MSNHNIKAITKELKTQILILGAFVAILGTLELIDQLLFAGELNRYGIRPRTLAGLKGILFAPFLHGDFEHLIANIIPLITLGWFVMLREISDFFIVTSVSMVVGGLGTWLIGQPGSVHIGASSLVFGYLGFLLLRGYFEGSFTAMALSAAAFTLYGGTIIGMFPNQPGISWQGHLFGFIGGILAARLLVSPHES
ncbi:MAG: rhomboid family intramembrane serine protease [Leptolyngbyaceae cyanobacterium MO_188.B28]|nr:rhomboid family intramembrane serine protease [Leptolyngbyaceae cyanobacterium MO_188.B28]